MKSLLAALFAATFTFALAQNPALEWVNPVAGSYHDWANDVAVDAAGNVFTSGTFYGTADFDPGPGVYNLSSNGQTDAYITKYDAAGNFRWARAWGGQDYFDAVAAIALDPAGNAYILGEFHELVDFNPGVGTFFMAPQGASDMFVLKLSPTGSFVWAKQIGGTDWESARDMAIDPYGNLVLIGVFSGTTDFAPGPMAYNLSSGREDIFISKLTATGSFVWAKQIGGTDFLQDAQAIALDSTGNIYATGSFLGTTDFDPGPGTAFRTAVGLVDGYLLKLDPAGNFQYVRHWGSAGQDHSLGIAVDPTGYAWITGMFEGSADFGLGAGSFTLNAGTATDGFVAKYDPAGNFVWATNWGNQFAAAAHSVVIDAAGNCYTTGTFGGTVDFNPGQGSFEMTTADQDLFVSKLGAGGSLVWAIQIDRAHGATLAMGNGEDFYLAGEFLGTADFDPTSGIHLLAAHAEQDAFTCKMNQSALGTPALAPDPVFKVFPNPTQGQLTVDFGEMPQTATLTVTNAWGQTLQTIAQANAQLVQLEIQGPAGIYFVRVTAGGKQATYRTVKE